MPLADVPCLTQRLHRRRNLVLLVDDGLFDAKKIALLTSRDPVLSRTMNFVQKGGWPQHPDPELSVFAGKRLELSVCCGVLMWGHRVIIPSRAREAVLGRAACGAPRHSANEGPGQRLRLVAASGPRYRTDRELLPGLSGEQTCSRPSCPLHVALA